MNLSNLYRFPMCPNGNKTLLYAIRLSQRHTYNIHTVHIYLWHKYTSVDGLTMHYSYLVHLSLVYTTRSQCCVQFRVDPDPQSLESHWCSLKPNDSPCHYGLKSVTVTGWTVISFSDSVSPLEEIYVQHWAPCVISVMLSCRLRYYYFPLL